jgi:hypothetical protein
MRKDTILGINLSNFSLEWAIRKILQNFKSASRNSKDYDIQYKSFTSCFVWEWNVVFYFKARRLTASDCK